MAHTLVPERTRECPDACVEACKAGARNCIESAEREMAGCAQLCLDCSTLCTACIPLLARDSRFSGALCRACADACEACAKECSRFEGEVMQRCACRHATEGCRRLAA